MTEVKQKHFITAQCTVMIVYGMTNPSLCFTGHTWHARYTYMVQQEFNPVFLRKNICSWNQISSTSVCAHSCLKSNIHTVPIPSSPLFHPSPCHPPHSSSLLHSYIWWWRRCIRADGWPTHRDCKDELLTSPFLFLVLFHKSYFIYGTCSLLVLYFIQRMAKPYSNC